MTYYYYVYGDSVTVIMRDPDGRGIGEVDKKDPGLPGWIRSVQDGFYDEDQNPVTESIDR